MAIRTIRINGINGIRITKECDSSTDYPNIANSTRFKDKSDGLIYYKDSIGDIWDIHTGNITSPSVTSGNILYVAITGSDTDTTKSGHIGKRDNPFLTLDAAANAAISGDTIHVFAGDYLVTTTATNGIAKSGVNWYFEIGAVVVKNTVGDLFNDTGYGTSFGIYGYGIFSKNTTSGYVFNNTLASLAQTYVFESIAVASNSNSLFRCTGASMDFKVQHATSTAGFCLEMAQSNLGAVNINIDCIKWKSTANSVIGYTWWYETKLNVNGDVLESTAAATINSINGGNKITLNVAQIIGVTYGISNGDGGGSSMSINTGRITGIYSVGYIISFNGLCENLYMAGGTLIGGQCEVITVTGGHVETTQTPFVDPSPMITVSGGVLDVKIGRLSYGITFNCTGGIMNILTAITAGQISDSLGRVINGGIVNVIGNFEHGGGPDYDSFMMFTLISGTLRLNSTCKNGFNVNARSHGILWSGGKLICNNAVLNITNTESYPIKALVPGLILKVNSGGLTTNRPENGGILAGKKHRWKYTVDSIATVLLTLNDLTGGDETFTETDTTTYNTKALLAQRMVSLINASGTLDITALQDTPGTDEYFYAEPDVAGVNIASAGINNFCTNMTRLLIREGSYPIGTSVGGAILEDIDAE